MADELLVSGVTAVGKVLVGQLGEGGVLQQINEALFMSPPAARALLAWDGTTLAGIAAYSFLWPAAGLTRSLYLKELYVADTYRRHGIGKLLMDALIEVAGKHRCSRVEWTADTDNPTAQAFYDTLGYPRHPAKILYRLEDTGTGLRGPAMRHTSQE